MSKLPPVYSAREEKANTLTHAFGIVVGLVATYFLLSKTWDVWSVTSYATYCVFMLSSYVTSTLYHYNKNTDTKKVLRKLDHAAIYLHIAGTYTPFTLVVLRNEGAWGWSLFAVIWLAAIVGVVLSFAKLKNASKLETICYIAMGWVVVIAFKPLIDALQSTDSMLVFWLLLAGGLAYTLGAVVYSLKKIEFTHAIWHLFVLAGTIFHALAIYFIKI